MYVLHNSRREREGGGREGWRGGEREREGGMEGGKRERERERERVHARVSRSYNFPSITQREKRPILFRLILQDTFPN